MWTKKANLEILKKVIPCFQKLEKEVYFDVSDNYDAETNSQIPYLCIHANAQKDVKCIRAIFPKSIWRKKYDENCKWWTYSAIIWDVEIKMIACHEAPKTCKAIIEKRVVERQVPTAFTTVKTEEDVIVGWDCGKAKS